MAPVLTPGCVFRVNTYLWVKLRTVTCLRWDEKTEERQMLLIFHQRRRRLMSFIPVNIRRCSRRTPTHCSNCGSFSLMTAQLVSDSSSVGHRVVCIIWEEIKGEKGTSGASQWNSHKATLECSWGSCSLSHTVWWRTLMVHMVPPSHHYVLHKEELLWIISHDMRHYM